MNRATKLLTGVLVTSALAVSLTATVAIGAASAQPVPLRFDAAASKMLGGSIHNRRTHVLVSIIGTYEYQRKVKIHGKWTKKNFWGVRVSTQHCKSTGCWGAIKHWNLPARWHYGKAVAGSSASVYMSGGDCPVSLINAIPLCTVPWAWVNTTVDKIGEKVINTVVDPCAKGSLLGFGGVAAVNIWTKILLDDGVITKAVAASKFEGPAGYAIGTAATCTVAVAARGGSLLQDLFH